jgi:hypothetical protein
MQMGLPRFGDIVFEAGRCEASAIAAEGGHLKWSEQTAGRRRAHDAAPGLTRIRAVRHTPMSSDHSPYRIFGWWSGSYLLALRDDGTCTVAVHAKRRSGDPVVQAVRRQRALLSSTSK